MIVPFHWFVTVVVHSLRMSPSLASGSKGLHGVLVSKEGMGGDTVLLVMILSKIPKTKAD